MERCGPLPMEVGEFLNWYRAAGPLKVFWLKPVERVEVVESSAELLALRVRWRIRRRKGRDAMIIASWRLEDPYSLLGRLGVELGGDWRLILVLPEGAGRPQGVDAEGILYFWDLSRLKLLEPCWEVEVGVYEELGREVLEALKAVHKASWGFHVPPRLGDHVVLVAWAEDRPVGCAYLNRWNYNLDYGVHVAREYWRRRVGTRLLWEAARLAMRLGARRISVVRVFRRRGGASSDRRAVAFYRANRPSCTLRVYRVA